MHKKKRASKKKKREHRKGLGPANILILSKGSVHNTKKRRGKKRCVLLRHVHTLVRSMRVCVCASCVCACVYCAFLSRIDQDDQIDAEK